MLSSCRVVITLRKSFNHDHASGSLIAKPRCLCRAEFCYVCAQPWKSCLCPVWDEQRLIDRANVVVERLPVPPAPDQRQAVLENVQRNIRDHHECNNHDWQRQSGGDICDGCGLEFPFFIYYCGLCQVLACSVCRHQRF